MKRLAEMDATKEESRQMAFNNLEALNKVASEYFKSIIIFERKGKTLESNIFVPNFEVPNGKYYRIRLDRFRYDERFNDIWSILKIVYDVNGEEQVMKFIDSRSRDRSPNIASFNLHSKKWLIKIKARVMRDLEQEENTAMKRIDEKKLKIEVELELELDLDENKGVYENSEEMVEETVYDDTELSDDESDDYDYEDDVEDDSYRVDPYDTEFTADEDYYELGDSLDFIVNEDVNIGGDFILEEGDTIRVLSEKMSTATMRKNKKMHDKGKRADGSLIKKGRTASGKRDRRGAGIHKKKMTGKAKAKLKKSKIKRAKTGKRSAKVDKMIGR